jgi:hypothetical protein
VHRTSSKERVRRTWPALCTVLALLGGALAQDAMPAPQLRVARVVDGWVAVDLVFSQTADLSLQIAGSTCAANVSPAVVKAPGLATVTVAPKGFNPCLVTLSVSDADGNSAMYRLSVGSPGESGFNVSLRGLGGFDPTNTPALGGKGTLRVNGGVGEFHLDGALEVTDAGAPSGELNLQYGGFQAFLGYGVGPSQHPAGAVGEGLYVSQRLGIFTLAAAAPWGQPVRFGAAVRSPYACASASLNAFLRDPAFGVQVGYNNLSASAQIRPEAQTVLSFNLEYRDPQWRFSFGGSERALALSGWGFVADSPLGWVLMQADVGLDLPTLGFSSNGSLESLNAVLNWTSDDVGLTEISLEGRWYDPLQALPLALREIHLKAVSSFIDLTGHLNLDAAFGNDEPLIFDAGLSLNAALDVNTYKLSSVTIGARAGIEAQARLPSGVYGGFLGLGTTDVGSVDAYTASLRASYANADGWQVRLEVAVPVTKPDGTTITLTVTSLSYLPVQPAPPTVRFVDDAYVPPPVAPVPSACRY